MQRNIVYKFASFFIMVAIFVGVDQWSKYEVMMKLKDA